MNLQQKLTVEIPEVFTLAFPDSAIRRHNATVENFVPRFNARLIEKPIGALLALIDLYSRTDPNGLADPFNDEHVLAPLILAAENLLSQNLGGFDGATVSAYLESVKFERVIL